MTDVDEVKRLQRLVAMQSHYIENLEQKSKAPQEQHRNSTASSGNGNGNASTSPGRHDLGAYEAQLLLATLKGASSEANAGTMDASLSQFLSPEPKPAKQPETTHVQPQRKRQDQPRGNGVGRRVKRDVPRARNRAPKPAFKQVHQGWNGRTASGPNPFHAKRSSSRQQQHQLRRNSHDDDDFDDDFDDDDGIAPPPEEDDGSGIGNGIDTHASRDVLLERLKQQAMDHESEIRALRESKNAALEDLHRHWKQVSEKRKAAHAQVKHSLLALIVGIVLICDNLVSLHRPLTKHSHSTEPKWNEWSGLFEVCISARVLYCGVIVIVAACVLTAVSHDRIRFQNAPSNKRRNSKQSWSN